MRKALTLLLVCLVSTAYGQYVPRTLRGGKPPAGIPGYVGRVSPTPSPTATPTPTVTPTPTPSPTPSPTITPTPTPSGPQLVQQKTGTIVGDTLTITMDAPFTAGNTLFVCVSYAGTSSISSMATAPGVQSGGNQDNTDVRSAIGNDIWFFAGTGDGTETGVTIVQVSALTRMSVWVGEFSGITPGIGHEDATSADATASSSVAFTRQINPVSANNLILASFGMVANDYSSGPTDGFTRATAVGGGVVYQEVAYKFQTSADAASTTWTLTAGINWASTISAFGGP